MMKRYFIDEFYIRNISAGSDRITLHCYGICEEEAFYFSFTLNQYELKNLLQCMKTTGKRIMKWLNGALFLDLVERLRAAVRVDNFWLSIKVTEICELGEPQKEYSVENYGFIPE